MTRMRNIYTISQVTYQILKVNTQQTTFRIVKHLRNELQCIDCQHNYSKYFMNVTRAFSSSCIALRQQETVMNVFDRKAKRMQKNRTAKLKDYHVYDYLREEVGLIIAVIVISFT